jgi:IMP dehydrogenase
MDGSHETWLSYDDVMIKPQRSGVDSRSDVTLSMSLTPSIMIDVPVIAAPMDSVCGTDMASVMNRAGATGFVHRFIDSPVEHAAAINSIEEPPRVGVIGINGSSIERAHKLYSHCSKLDAFCVDVAHGHLEKALETVEFVSEQYPDIDLIAGNVATGSGASDLFGAGADTVKVGIGPGGACTTREKTGVGVPQITAVRRAADEAGENQYIIADGGVRSPGDVAKAIVAGADTVMIGSYFAGCPESPMDNMIRGMASSEAQQDNGKSNIVEGGVKSVEKVDSAMSKVRELSEGLASAASYCGAESLAGAQEAGTFVRVTDSAARRSGIHEIS